MWQSLLCLVVYCNNKNTDLLSRQQVTVTSYTNPPYLMLKSDEAALSGNEKYEGLLVDLLNGLERHLGCSFNINVVKDGRYGYENNIGNWSGMVGEIVRGEADLAVADLTMSPNRMLAVDWTIPYMSSGIVPVIASDGNGDAPSNLQDIIDSGAEIYTVAGGATMNFFKTTSDSVFSSIYKNLKYVSYNKEGIEKVREGKGKVVLMMESASAKHHANNDCSLKIVGEPLNTANYGLAMQRGAALKWEGAIVEYRTLFNWALSQMHGSGEMQKLINKWFASGSC